MQFKGIAAELIEPDSSKVESISVDEERLEALEKHL